MIVRLLRVAGLLGSLVASATTVASQNQQQPRFQSGVEVVTIDVTVVDGDGRPILDLQPRDFVVEVDGVRRRVVTAEWIAVAPSTATASPAAGTSAIAPIPAYTSNEIVQGGRLILLAIDQPNIRFGGAIPHREAINRFVDLLQPFDRVAVVGLGVGAKSLPFTSDHAKVKEFVSRTVGGVPYPPLAADKTAGEQTIDVLRHLLLALAPIDAPKTIVLVSQGLVLGEYRHLLEELEKSAAQSRTIIYSLRLDERISDITGRQLDTSLGPDLTEPPAGSGRGSARSQGLPDEPFPAGPAGEPGANRTTGGEGLYLASSVTGGAVFPVVMNADAALARIASELSGYYLLAVEADPSYSDGDLHGVKVDVNRSGVTVRSRRQLIANVAKNEAATAEEVLLTAFSSPLPITALPIRASTFSMRNSAGTGIQLMIHAEVGADYTAPKSVVLGFVIADRNDRVVQRRAGNSTLRPVAAGRPSPLQVTTSVTLEPGDYTMKFAVADGDRVGSVEHLVHASIESTGPVSFSDLVVGGVSSAAVAVPPPVGPIVRGEYVQGLIEAYGAEALAVRGRFEVAASIDGPALATVPIAASAAGRDRSVLAQVLAVRDLRPGRYVLRAVLAAPNAAPRTIIRAFEKP